MNQLTAFEQHRHTAPTIVGNQLHVLTTERIRHTFDTQLHNLVVYNIQQLSRQLQAPAFVLLHQLNQPYQQPQHNYPFYPESRHPPNEPSQICYQPPPTVAKNVLQQHVDIERQYNAYMAQHEVRNDGTQLSTNIPIANDPSHLCTQFFVRYQLQQIVENAMRQADEECDVEMRDVGATDC